MTRLRGTAAANLPGLLDFYIYCGDAFRRDLLFRTWNEADKDYTTRLDISGYTTKAQVRSLPGSAVSFVREFVISGDATLGELTLQMASEVTAELKDYPELVWDLQFTKITNPANVTTAMKGVVYPLTETTYGGAGGP